MTRFDKKVRLICKTCKKVRFLSRTIIYQKCSGNCLSCSMLGNKRRKGLKYVMKKETKEKIRITKIGKPFSGKSFSWKGLKMSQETKKKMSLSSLGKKKSKEHCKSISQVKKGKTLNHIAGENHYRWIKDRTQIKIGERSLNDPLQKGWRKAVKDRDNWVCRIADTNCDGRLEAHHILPWKDFPELRYEINNGITLCRRHHPRKKADVEKLSPYFQSLVASLD